MSPQYETPLRLELSLTTSYQRWLLFLYVSAVLVTLLVTSLAFSLKLLALLLIGTAGFRQWQQVQGLPCRLIQQDEDSWLLEGRDGRVVAARLLSKGYVSRWLIILHFGMADKKERPLVILPYMLDANCYRRLCVYLRMNHLQRLTDE